MDRPSLLATLRGKTHEARQRRQARSARWGEPITSSADRRAAWASLVFADHGIFRLLYQNRHRVTGALWRSAQPAPGDIRWAARQGIRTVITLRNGYAFGSWPLEREACAAAGIDLVRMPLFSREPPTLEMIEEIARTFDQIAYPALMHCKSGADRAGLGAALYLLLKEGRTADEALDQLGLGYGHVRWGRTGILDHFLKAYRGEGEAKGLGFLEWARTAYDRERVVASFASSGWANLLVDRVLRRE